MTDQQNRALSARNRVSPSEEISVVFPIKIHWSLTVFLISINILFVTLMIRSLLDVSTGPLRAQSAIGIIVLLLLLFLLDFLAVPIYKKHYVAFGKKQLHIVTGKRCRSLPYLDIEFVSENIYRSAYQYRPTAPGAIRIQGRMFDEAVAIQKRNEFYLELRQQNPKIIIDKKSLATKENA